MSAFERFFGDRPLRVLLKLIVLSFVVGLVMSAFDWTPWTVYKTVRDVVLQVWQMGFSALGRFGDYMVVGAAIVVPAFLLLRLFSYRR
jgi:hypothetical protein